MKPIFHAAILITTFSWPVANGLGQRSVTIGVWPDNFPGRGRKSHDAPGSHTGAAKNPGRRAIAAPTVDLLPPEASLKKFEQNS
ncbi:MAG: hypothetical protein DMF45_14010 [Verrucomicrobia bacterium]|nr:MAG: hypothetical protein DMF45_14010 [Verrucomicrobiota bacterium]